MALGDQADFLGRLKAVLPMRWFGTFTPVLDTALAAPAWLGSFIYSLIGYIKLQTRLKTATDGFLDMIAYDFFGVRIQRRANQSDASFLARIIAEILRPRGTRGSVIQVLIDITGRTPTVFEPSRPLDTGAWNGPYLAWGVAGGWGSLLMPFQCLVNAYRPLGTGIPNVMGWGVPVGAWNRASQIQWANLSMVKFAIPDADIYAAVDSVMPAGTVAWTRINN